MKIHYSINSVQGSIHQGSETFSKPLGGMQCAVIALSALFHNESVPVHSWTKSVIDQILHQSWRRNGDGMYSHCTFKQLSAVLNILRNCRWMDWWQILFMILNLRRDMATAALHFSLRTASYKNYVQFPKRSKIFLFGFVAQFLRDRLLPV